MARQKNDTAGKAALIAGLILVALAVWFGMHFVRQFPRVGEKVSPSLQPTDAQSTPSGGRAGGGGFQPESPWSPEHRTLHTKIDQRAATPVAVPAPANVKASEGTYRDRVLVTWSATANATLYKVTRRVADSTSVPVDLGWVGPEPSPSYIDKTAGNGEYEYRVFAANAESWSPSSAAAFGWRGKLDAPEVIFATDRTYPDKIDVTWDTVRGAVSYELFRTQLRNVGVSASISGVDDAQDLLSEISDPAQDVVIYPCRENQLTDTALAPNVFYAYRVRAKDSAGGYSAFSRWDRGSARPISKTLTAPAWVRASSVVPGIIVLAWEDETRRPGYEIWRSDQPDVAWAKIVEPGASGGIWVDRDAVPGTKYYYWVRSGDGGKTLSAFSPAASVITAQGQKRGD